MDKNIAFSFRKNIETMDYYRFYHKKWKSTRYNRNLGSFERLKLAKKCDGGIKKYDLSLWRLVQKECREMGETHSISKKDRFYTMRLIGTLFLVLFFIFASFMFNLIIFVILLFITIIISIILALFAVKEGIYLSQKAIRKSYKQKNLVQELINDGIDFFKKESIDPVEYPLKLKFNDYSGLKQIKEKRKLLISKEYIFYLDLDVIDAPKFIEEKISEEKTYKEALSSFIRTSIVIFILLIMGISIMIILRQYVIMK